MNDQQIAAVQRFMDEAASFMQEVALTTDHTILVAAPSAPDLGRLA